MPDALKKANKLGLTDFSKRVRECREELKMTQGELATACGLESYRGDGGSVAHWEAGRAFPSIPRLVVLSDVLGVTTDYLLFGDQ